MSQEMLKILFILPNLHPGGAERAAVTLLQNLNRSVFSPTLFLIKGGGILSRELPPQVKVVTALKPNQNLFIFLPYVLILFLVTAAKNQIYFGCLELTATYLAYLAGKIFGRPIVGWVHIDIRNYDPANRILHKNLSSFIYPKLDKVIVVSEGVFESVLVKFPKVNKLKIEILYNPIPIKQIHSKSLETSKIIFSNKPVILGVGRLHSQKRFDLLIKAHALLLKEGIENDLYILGEGPEKQSLCKLINSLNVFNSVKLWGYQPNPYQFMKSSTIFVLSSDSEGLPTVVIEAMALGLPIIATDCRSGPKEILEDGKYGILVSTNNEAEIAEAIKRILLIPELANNLRNIGPQKAQDFSLERTIPIWEEMFKKTLALSKLRN